MRSLLLQTVANEVGRNMHTRRLKFCCARLLTPIGTIVGRLKRTCLQGIASPKASVRHEQAYVEFHSVELEGYGPFRCVQ